MQLNEESRAESGFPQGTLLPNIRSPGPTRLSDEAHRSTVTHCENDHKERESYAANIEAENCENDLQQVLNNEASDLINSGCMYTDVNSARQLPTLQMLLAILNLKKD